MLLAIAATAILPSPAGPAGPFPVRASAPTVVPTFQPTPAIAGHDDIVRFVLSLNATGTGQFQWVGVDVAFEEPLGVDVDAAGATAPASCVAIAVLSWRCSNFRAGVYDWTVPAHVLNTTRPGFAQNATALLSSSDGPLPSAEARLLVDGAAIDVVIGANPSLSARPGELVQYNVSVENARDETANATNTAYDVTLTIRLDPGLVLGAGAPNLTVSTPVLTPGSILSLPIQAIILSNVSPGGVVGIEATVTYREFNNHTVILAKDSAPLYIRSPVDSAPILVAAAGTGLAAIVATLVVLLYLGQRRIVIDEAFLMHRNGVLLHHASRGPSAKKDDDLVASMLVAIQEFVRDSFRSEKLLDSVSFGGRRAALVRGKYVILVAVISRGDVDYVIPQMLAAVRNIERAHGKILASWDGRMTKLLGIQGIMNRLLRGGYRSTWRAELR